MESGGVVLGQFGELPLEGVREQRSHGAVTMVTTVGHEPVVTRLWSSSVVQVIVVD